MGLSTRMKLLLFILHLDFQSWRESCSLSLKLGHDVKPSNSQNYDNSDYKLDLNLWSFQCSFILGLSSHQVTSRSNSSTYLRQAPLCFSKFISNSGMKKNIFTWCLQYLLQATQPCSLSLFSSSLGAEICVIFFSWNDIIVWFSHEKDYLLCWAKVINSKSMTMRQKYCWKHFLTINLSYYFLPCDVDSFYLH